MVPDDQLHNYVFCYSGNKVDRRDNKGMVRPFVGLEIKGDGKVVGWQDFSEDGIAGSGKYAQLNIKFEPIVEPELKQNRGVYGQFSKLEEEFAEMKEAYENSDSIALLTESSDFIGALEEFIEKQFPPLTLNDLILHSNNKKKAYAEGKLVNRDGTAR
jgi:hypothetical protein